jgi:DNA-binding MarR family transcriptional regulator
VIEPKEEPGLTDNPAKRAWDLMSEIWKTFKPWIEEVASGFGLTPQQLLAVKILGEYGAMAMSELAVQLGCDASNVTSIVDKLEVRGLAERRSSEQDRRVKTIVLSAAGTELFAAATKRFQKPPAAIDNLCAADQEALCAIFRRSLDSLYAADARASTLGG